jgi:drug/metabolite transporter (DMT)-like permease
MIKVSSLRRVSGSEHRYGFWITLFGVLLLCPDTLLVRMIQAEGGELFSITFWRGTLTGIGLLLLYRIFSGDTVTGALRRMDRWSLLVAFLIGFQAVCFVVALELTSVANTLLLVATSPLFSALFSWWFLHETPPFRTWVTIGFALAGVSMIIAQDLDQPGSLLGDLAAAGTAMGLGGSFVVVRYRRVVNMIPAAAIGKLLSGLCVLPWIGAATLSATGYGLLLFLSLIILPASFGLLTLGPRYIPAPEVSLLLLLETVLAPLLVWMVLGEAVETMALTGGLIVVASLAAHAAMSFRRA